MPRRKRNGAGESAAGASSPLYFIQALRGLAAVMVVVHHATIMSNERLGWLGRPWWSGAAGVDLFFVISGVVMALSCQKLVQRSRPAVTFLARRLERIVPLYWLATTARVVLLLAAPALATRGVGTAWHVLASYLFVPSRSAEGTIFPVLIVGWTLEFEMLFYLVITAALAVRRDALQTVAVVFAVMIPVGLMTQDPAAPAILSLAHPILLEFLFGMALWRAYTAWPDLLPVWACAGLSALAFADICLQPHGGSSIWRPLQWGFPAAVIVGCALWAEKRLGSKVPWWLRRIGDSSYSLYLMHTFVLPVVALMLLRWSPARAAQPWIAVPIALAASLLVAEAVFRWVETPMMRFFKSRAALQPS